MASSQFFGAVEETLAAAASGFEYKWPGIFDKPIPAKHKRSTKIAREASGISRQGPRSYAIAPSYYGLAAAKYGIHTLLSIYSEAAVFELLRLAVINF